MVSKTREIREKGFGVDERRGVDTGEPRRDVEYSRKSLYEGCGNWTRSLSSRVKCLVSEPENSIVCTSSTIASLFFLLLTPSSPIHNVDQCQSS